MGIRNDEQAAIGTRGAAIAALALLALLPVLPMLDRLGLYSDDYGIFIGFEQVRHGPWTGIAEFILEGYATRPAQGLASALLYYSFGLDPLPYVLVEAGLVAASAVLLWKLLGRLGADPALAFAAAALFAVLPQLSTVRLWFSTLCVAAALLCFLAGALCLLRWLRDGRAWASVAALALWALSLAFYELFVPLMVAVIGYAWWQRAEPGRPRQWLPAGRPLLPHLLLIAAALGAKALVTDRTDGWYPKSLIYQAIKLDYVRETDFGFNLWAFIHTHFVDTVAFPLRSLAFFASFEMAAHIATAVLAGAIIGVGVGRFEWRLSEAGRFHALWAGLSVALLGYGIFALNASTSFTPAGIGNRTAAASAIGLAVAIAALAMLAAGRAPPRLRRALGGLALGLVGFGFTLASLRVSEHWARASEIQLAVIEKVRSDLGSIRPGSVVLLDGLCPYDGPAIIFETDWDVAGALSLVLGRPVSANLITPQMRFGRRGAATRIYAFDYFYPYGPDTYAYDARTRSATRLSGWSDARSYLASREPPACPRGYPGHGVPI